MCELNFEPALVKCEHVSAGARCLSQVLYLWKGPKTLWNICSSCLQTLTSTTTLWVFADKSDDLNWAERFSCPPSLIIVLQKAHCIPVLSWKTNVSCHFSSFPSASFIPLIIHTSWPSAPFPWSFYRTAPQRILWIPQFTSKDLCLVSVSAFQYLIRW